MNSHFYPVILAGGRGTRFWPLSRRRRAKQVLALEGSRSMIQQTVARLAGLAPRRNFWVITNPEVRPLIRRQLPLVAPRQILAEPAGRNTAPAIGLAAFLLLRRDPQAVLGMFPADHTIAPADVARFRRAVERAAALAARGPNIIVMGIAPTRPETGYGYIEVEGDAQPQSGAAAGAGIRRVRRFTEKPDAERARAFLASGAYFWNSGMFVWSAATLAAALREYLSESARYLEKIAAAWGASGFARTFARLYPKCRNISVDYAVLEPCSAPGAQASNLYCIPADFRWNDLGSWAALYQQRAAQALPPGNVLIADSSFALEARGNFIHAPGKFVAALGVEDLVVVETEDALLITTRARAQEVGKVVRHLEEKKMARLL